MKWGSGKMICNTGKIISLRNCSVQHLVALEKEDKADWEGEQRDKAGMGSVLDRLRTNWQSVVPNNS